MEKVAKNVEEGIKERVERIQSKKEKWEGKIQAHKVHVKHVENENHSKGVAQTKAIRAYIEEKRKKDMLERTDTL